MYSKDGPFSDPVLRCDSCGTLILVERLKHEGSCVCGVRKVRNVKHFTEAELAKMKKWGVDPKFIELFEPVEEEE